MATDIRTYRCANRDVVTYALSGKYAEGYGAMSTSPGIAIAGALPHPLRRVLDRRHRRVDPDTGRIEFVRNIRQMIYSYNTPIAWLDLNSNGEPVWVVPSVRYSVTTSKHQGYLWKLGYGTGNSIVSVPRDVSYDEYMRAIDGKMIFAGQGTIPGPNWKLD